MWISDSKYRACRAFALGAFILSTVLGCGGGGSMSSTATAPGTSAQACGTTTCGSAITTLTDAAGDFLSYKVNLVSLQLTKKDGTLVEILPSQTTVDFAQLVNLSEILSVKQIPKGDYISAQVTIDFTGASILVDDGTGTPVAVSPIDASGAAVTTLQMSVQLDTQHPLSINDGKASRLAFDFNLLASNTVDLTLKTVTVSPVLVASAVAPDHKDLRVRGSLSSVDSTALSIVLDVQPFEEQSKTSNNTVTVKTTTATAFEVNGTPYDDATGIAQLAALPAGTMVIALGTLSSTDQSFTATRVLAGTSVEGGGLDHLTGDVVSRTGNTLVLHAAELEDHQGAAQFETRSATVTIADATGVTVDGQTSATPAHTIAEISVGSRVRAFGTASRDSSGNVTLDASTGRVRIEPTHISGTVTAIGNQQLTFQLNSIDRLPLSLFDFSGTHSDPSQYVVASGNLPLTGFSTGKAAQGIGFVDSFGAAPPDFTAVTLSNSQGGPGIEGEDHGGDAGAELEIDWGKAGTSAPFKTVDAMHLEIDIANSQIGEHHTIDAQPTRIDLTTLSSDPSIVPDTGTTTQLFAIAHQKSRRIENFNAFADFETAVTADLNGTVTALGMAADGAYDATANTFTARHLVLMLND